MQPGDVLAGRWRLDRRADAGGMGVVHRGTDLSSGAPVAIKVLVTDGERERARFGREARALAELAHPAIVRYLDHGVVDGQPYLVMEWVDGESLADRIARVGVTIGEAIALVRRAADGLAVAHRRGLVHRDVKPRNLLLPDGDPARLKVIDFGIAYRSDASVRLTRSGGLVGTPAYVAPELARGDGDADARADVFSLGCVLFECVAGRPAFAGGGAWAVLARILLEEPPRLSELVPHVSPELDALVARMLAKDPAARPADAAAVIAELDALPPPPADAAAMVAAAEEVLTADEQRLVAVVLVASAAAAPWSTVTLAAEHDTAATLAPPLPLPVLAEVVTAHGARFERLLGGPVAIVLEGGGAATDRAGAAARCALALRRVAPDAVVALAVGRVQARAGAHVSLIGDAIDRALALIDGVEPAGNGVRLDAVAAGLLDAGFVVDDDGSGGRRLIAERAGLTPRPLLGRPTPFVGRDRELAMLQAMVAGGAEQASCVLISGPPGGGKSRLVGELLARQAWIDPWIARGDALAAGSPLGLLGQIVRASAGISEHDPPAARRARLLEAARDRFGGVDAIRVAGFLAEVAGAPEPADRSGDILLAAARQDVRLMADQIRRAWEDWVVAACRRAPVVIVLEDLHWSDRATVALIDVALAACADLPLVVIASARPEVHELFGDPWAARGVQEIRLAPLPRRACERLVRAALGDQLATEVLDRVVAQADGNALFLEELIRAVAAGASELPATVVAMVSARLQAMEPEVRRVLRAASVFGQRFRAAGVAALLGAGEVGRDDVERWLELLVEREVVGRAGDGEHAFRHALVRDAAYAMLTDDDRPLGHRLAAAWLERIGDAEPRVLAEHHERAGDPRRAARWWRRAAEIALEGNDYDAAVLTAERGIDAGAEDEVGALRAVQVEAHRWLGDFAAAEVAAERALVALPRGGAPWCAVAYEAVRASHRTGRRDRLLAIARDIAEVATAGPMTAFQLRTAYTAAEHLLRVGERAAAAPLLALGDAADPKLRDQPMVAGAAAEAMGIVARFAGDPAGMVRAAEAAAHAYDSVGDQRRTLLMTLSLGDSLIHAGDPARALAVLTATCDQAVRDAPGLIGFGRLNLGLARHHLGDLDGADLDLRSSLDRSVAAGNRDLEGFARLYRATLLLDRGGDAAVAEATIEVERALERFAHAAPARGLAIGVRSRARLAAGDVAGARADADAAMAILADAGLQEGEAEVRLAHLDALIAAGELEAAAAALAAARHRLDQRAAGFGDDAAAQRFRAVPVNAALAARAELLSRPR